IGENKRPGVKLGGGRKRAAPKPRVGAIKRKVNRSGRIWIGQDERVAGRDQTAKPREDRCIKLRVEPGSAELIQENRGALRKPRVHTRFRVQPGLVGVTGAPPSRFADDRAVDFRLAFGPACFGWNGRQGSAVKAVL